MYELCQVDAVMKKMAYGHAISIPVDVLLPVNVVHNGWGPLVMLLNVL
jgi:hypothetical protein